MKKMTLRGLMTDLHFDKDLAQCLLALSKARGTGSIMNALVDLERADIKDEGETRDTLDTCRVYFNTHTQNPQRLALNLMNILGEFSGVEYLGETHTGKEVEYFNAGDLYVPTIFMIEGNFYIEDIGSYRESHPKFKLYEGFEENY